MTAPAIRLLSGNAELQQCVAFQKLVWGADFAEVVPAAILMVAGETGGIVAGAFDPGDGAMVGFIFGITGFVDGAPLHWSDMLAVHPDRRGRGLGQALKRFQRSVLLGRGITRVRWTFDPLEARNAHLNFSRLGVTARAYVRDLYGASTSPLHRGLPTDRLIVDWQLDSARVRLRMGDAAGADAVPAGAAAAGGGASALGDVAVPAAGGAPTPPASAAVSTPPASATAPAVAAAPLANPAGAPLRLDLAAPSIRIRIPAAIQSLKASDPAAARDWRSATRAAFETYFARGYVALAVEREPDSACYVLDRAAEPGAAPAPAPGGG